LLAPFASEFLAQIPLLSFPFLSYFRYLHGWFLLELSNVLPWQEDQGREILFALAVKTLSIWKGFRKKSKVFFAQDE
jgi:hypothetical protein